MKFTLSMLKDFLDTDASLNDIADALNNLGLEVEEIINPADTLGAFTVAKITKAEQHPDADRLRVCTVATKDGDVQIVCGAPNARSGINVCLSVPGMYIPGLDITIKKGKIRGVESCGMLCSVEELGMEADGTDGILELPADADIGARVIDILDMNDPLIEIAITPNRPDALGVYGIARDLAAYGLGTLKALNIPEISGTFESPISFEVTHSDSCPHFVGAYIKGVKNVAAPDWLKKRLAAVGCSSHSALVDITNYISYMYARPLHVFDADKIGSKMVARLADDGEKINDLKENEHSLLSHDIVIADENAPHAIAGIMGGFDSGCSDDTQNVFLESAYFDPKYIAATGRRLNLLSDARYRFERGIDPAFTQDGAKIALQMILDLCGGEASKLVISGEARQPDEAFALNSLDVKNLTGVDIEWATQKEILTKLGFKSVDQGAKIIAIPPSYRPDIKGSADLIEEIIRIHGINKVPALMLPETELARPLQSAAQKRIVTLRRNAVDRGLNESVTYSFVSEAHAKLFGGGADHLRLSNPISSILSDMRPSILPSLMTAASKNNARGLSDFSSFEIGRVFHGLGEKDQPMQLAVLRSGQNHDKHWADAGRAFDVFDAKADALALLESVGAPVSGLQARRNAPNYYHPGRSGVLCLGKNVFANFGQIHPKITKAFDLPENTVACEIMIDNVPLPKQKKTTSLPALNINSLQSVSRDFAFVMDKNTEADSLLRAIFKADKKLIADASIFDIYEGEHIEAGKKSVAVNVTLQPKDASLTDKDIETISNNILAEVSKATGAFLR